MLTSPTRPHTGFRSSSKRDRPAPDTATKNGASGSQEDLIEPEPDKPDSYNVHIDMIHEPCSIKPQGPPTEISTSREKETLDCCLLLASDDLLEPGYVYLDSVPLLCESCDMPLAADVTLDAAHHAVTEERSLSELTLTHSPTINAYFSRSQTIVSAYENTINHFRHHLDTSEFEKMTKVTTFTEVVTALIACKSLQMQGKRQGRRRQYIDRLLQRVHHYKDVVEVAGQGYPDIVSIVWASMRFLISATSSFVTIQTRLANMLSEVADCIGRVELFKTIFPTEHMLCTVANLYSELVDMLRLMVTYWKKNRLDQRIFNAFWNPFEVEYQSSIERIRYLVNQIDRTAAASHMAATQAQNAEITFALRNIQARLDDQQNSYMILESQTVFASRYSQRLRRYLLPVAAQEDEDSILQYNLARQTYGTCDFILEHKSYHQWQDSRGSQLLGLVGGPGSGKTIISAFLYSQAQIQAKEHSPVVWLHCYPQTRTNCMYLLRSLTWKILEQRPDVLLKKLHDQGHYIRLFHEARTFEVLWGIFVQIISTIKELWIVIDSIHDCQDGKLMLVNKLKGLVMSGGLHTRIKIVISSRNASDLDVVTTQVIKYTAQDMRQGITAYMEQELMLNETPAGLSLETIRAAAKTVESSGGGLHWALAVIHLVRSARSEDDAKVLLSRLQTPDLIVHHLWQKLLLDCRSELNLVTNLAELMATHPFSPLSVIKIYDMLSEKSPDLVVNTNVKRVGELLKSDFAGFLSRVDGRYSMQNEIRRHLLREMAITQIAKDKEISLVPVSDNNQQPPAPVLAARKWGLEVLGILCLAFLIYQWLW